MMLSPQHSIAVAGRPLCGVLLIFLCSMQLLQPTNGEEDCSTETQLLSYADDTDNTLLAEKEQAVDEWDSLNFNCITTVEPGNTHCITNYVELNNTMYEYQSACEEAGGRFEQTSATRICTAQTPTEDGIIIRQQYTWLEKPGCVAMICPEDYFDTYFLSSFAYLDTQMVDGVCITETVEDGTVWPTYSPLEEGEEESASSSSPPMSSTKTIVFMGVKLLPIFLVVALKCLF